MRLLSTERIELEDFGGNELMRYAIFSHTWGEEEVTLQDMKTKVAMELKGYEKVKRACSVAAEDGFKYIWIDTCCIDKTSSAELSEALNSMYRWYQEADECYAYLEDVLQGAINHLTGVVGPEFQNSRWFKRGWTLQELIAPSSVIFLSKEWQEIGTKSDLHLGISKITGIPTNFLLGDDIGYASVAQRMSWASRRVTTRVEDLAYCLMGLFGIYMPMLYGEGERAFVRLQEEIMKVSDDHSLFAWRSTEDHGGILATSPAAFVDSGHFIPTSPSYTTSDPSTLSARGIHLSLPFNNDGLQRGGLATLNCTEMQKESLRLAIRLRGVFPSKEDFAREQSSMLELVHVDDINPLAYPWKSVYVQKCRPTRNRKWEDIEKCIIKLEGVGREDSSSRIINLDSNWHLHDVFMVRDTVAIPDGVLGRFLVTCNDGNLFQILLKKRGGFLSANISSCSNSDPRIYQGPTVPNEEEYDKDRIVKTLDNGQYVHIAIKKRVLSIREQNCRTAVVEISYSGTVEGFWLGHIFILEEDAHEKTILSYAAGRGYESVVRLLLEKSVEPAWENGEGQTLLSRAVRNGHETVVRLLLENFELKGKGSRTLLSWVIKRLSLKKDVKLESKDKKGQTLLSWVARHGYGRIAQLLLEKGANPESKDKSGLTPLSWGAMNGHEGVVQLLLEKGANLESKDNSGMTPLSKAARKGHEGVVLLLLEKGANPESKDNGSWTPLSKAARKGHEGIVLLLLEKGANLESKNIEGLTPLD